MVTSGQRSERRLQSILRSTRGIALLGTPHHSAGLVRCAEFVCQDIGILQQPNAETAEALRGDSEELVRMQDSFRKIVVARDLEGMQSIEVSCFYEELPVPTLGFVS